MMKRCNKCGQTKPQSEFGKNRSKRDGLSRWCLACCRERDRQRDSAPERRKRKREYLKYRTWWLRLWVLTILTDGAMRCRQCGTSEDLQIDHVYGDGRKHRLASGRKPNGNWKRNARYHYFRSMLESGCVGLQCLCRRCNTAKGKSTPGILYRGHDPLEF